MKRSVLTGPEGHPFHPFVVPLPIGAFVSSLIFDVLTRTRADGLPYLVDGAFWLIGVGLIGALIAAMFGALDLLTIRRRTPPFATAVAHLTLNVAASGAVPHRLRLAGRGPRRTRQDPLGAAHLERSRCGLPRGRRVAWSDADLSLREEGHAAYR